MKKTTITSLIITASLTISYIHAYEYSFFNNTNTPIGIAIQYTGNDTNEPLYKKLAKPQEMAIFTPGEFKIPDIKWGFCLNTMYYIENPTTEQKAHNFEKTTWKKIPITWTKEKSTTKKKTKKQQAPKKEQPPIEQKPVNPATPAQQSLCRDRHFDIKKDEHGKIIITSSLSE